MDENNMDLPYRSKELGHSLFSDLIYKDIPSSAEMMSAFASVNLIPAKNMDPAIQPLLDELNELIMDVDIYSSERAGEIIAEALEEGARGGETRGQTRSAGRSSPGRHDGHEWHDRFWVWY